MKRKQVPCEVQALEIDDDFQYLRFKAVVRGEAFPGLFRINDPERGSPYQIVYIDSPEDFPISQEDCLTMEMQIITELVRYEQRNINKGR